MGDGEKKSKFQIMREEYEEKILETQNDETEDDVDELDKNEVVPHEEFSGVNFKLNEFGDLVFDQETVKTQKFDKTKFKKDSSSEFTEMDKYKRCLMKPNKKIQLNNRKWSEKDNDLFWKGLAVVGQDFQLLANYFKTNGSLKTKNQIKSKFKKEDKVNADL